MQKIVRFSAYEASLLGYNSSNDNKALTVVKEKQIYKRGKLQVIHI